MSAGPLRFCMITTFYPPYSFGGDAVFVQRLSNELVRRDHAVEVIHCADSYRLLAGREPVGASGDDPRVIVHALRSRVGPLSPFATQQTGYPLFKSAAIRRILDRGFDVIHFHNVSLVGGPGVLSYGRAVRLYTLHEYWLACPTHVLFKDNRAACTRPSCLGCQLRYRRPPQWWRYTGLLRRSIRHVDAFLAPSRFSLEKHRELGLDFPGVHLPSFIPDPPDAGAAAGGQHDAPGRPYFLFLGRLEKLKGLQTLFPVFRERASVDLLVAGSGSFETELRQMAGGCANIRFLGGQPAERVRALLRGAVALMVPSICFEVFPNVALEALSEGTPVIARNIGGLPEQLEQGGGLLYDSDEELGAAVDRLLQDGGLREELGLQGRAAYRTCWTAELHVERYLELIHELKRSGKSQPQLADGLPSSTSEGSFDPLSLNQAVSEST